MSGLLESLKSMYAHDATVLAGIENGSVRGIPLTRGKITIVDADNYEWLNRWKWCTEKGRYTFYAVRGLWVNKKMIHVSMHREILGLIKGDGKMVDHKNRNGLDNRGINLRVADYYLNSWNRKTRIDNQSGYRGVSWHKQHKKWQVRISKNGIRKHCGIYSDLETATMVYKEESVGLWGREA